MGARATEVEIRVNAGKLFAIVALALSACAEQSAPNGAQPAAGIGGAMPNAGAGGGMLPGAGMMPSAGAGASGGAGGAGGIGMLPGGGMMPSAGASASGGAGGMPSIDAGSDSMMPDIGADPGYHDPAQGPWEMGTADECKMDTSLITGIDNLAVIRYGKLCHIQGGNTSGPNWSATKTLGGVLAGRAAYLVKDVPRTGPGTGPILHEDKATDWVGPVTFNNEALLSHVMSMTAFNTNLAYGSKSFAYDTVGTREISTIVEVAMVAVEQLGGSVPSSDSAFMQQEVFDKLGMTDSIWPGGTIGFGWSSTLEDMARVGVMLVHDGWYGGERFMEASWVYRMSHPAHEDANTAYGQLVWLNQRGAGNGFGARIDECAPAAFWPVYPHVGSEATDCRATSGTCEQEHDVGVFSAMGLNGQFIVMHPGLDLVIVAHNSSSPLELWAAVRPAVVAMDPMFMGDETSFCEAYGAGSYAPDLLAPRIAPTE